ncbi:MAG TPA: DUF5996 family protein [Solirubrobacteraceae bacterium]|nr:DUF5996 family protein [Solirubrobacteraceae bacterium]
MSRSPSVDYRNWAESCDTLHAHSQVLGKLAATLGAPEPQLQHAALRLTARGWETPSLAAPDRSGAFVAGFDLRMHEAFIEHTTGASHRVALTPNRSVGEVTRELLAAVAALAGPVELELNPQEVSWTVPLDQDEEHATYDTSAIERYFAAATQAALVLAAYRAPYRGRSTPVNAWWGSFDLAVSLFSGLPAEAPADDFIMRNAMDSQEVAVGWWPGDQRYPQAAFYAYTHPHVEGFAAARLSPEAARWEETLGEFVLDWNDVCDSEDPHAAGLTFARSALRRACIACDWDPALLASAEADPPPIR